MVFFFYLKLFLFSGKFLHFQHHLPLPTVLQTIKYIASVLMKKESIKRYVFKYTKITAVAANSNPTKNSFALLFWMSSFPQAGQVSLRATKFVFVVERYPGCSSFIFLYHPL
jgi:hypothetical protein